MDRLLAGDNRGYLYREEVAGDGRHKLSKYSKQSYQQCESFSPVKTWVKLLVRSIVLTSRLRAVKTSPE